MLPLSSYCAMPDTVTFEEAASLPVAYGTAHRMLITHKTVQPGDKVVILGASGGVGTGCVILCKMLGAEVIACASSAAKLQRLKELGADHVLNYQEVDFSQWVIDTYGKPQRRSYDGGVDVVINFTGGDTWRPSLRCVKRGGSILVCGATAGYDPPEDLRYIWTFELKIIGSNSFYNEDLTALMTMIAQGTFKPVIDCVLPLDPGAGRAAADSGPGSYRQGGHPAIGRELASMRQLYNLGDLIDRSRDLHKTAVIDLGGETVAAHVFV